MIKKVSATGAVLAAALGFTLLSSPAHAEPASIDKYAHVLDDPYGKKDYDKKDYEKKDPYGEKDYDKGYGKDDDKAYGKGYGWTYDEGKKAEDEAAIDIDAKGAVASENKGSDFSGNSVLSGNETDLLAENKTKFDDQVAKGCGNVTAVNGGGVTHCGDITVFIVAFED